MELCRRGGLERVGVDPTCVYLGRPGRMGVEGRRRHRHLAILDRSHSRRQPQHRSQDRSVRSAAATCAPSSPHAALHVGCPRCCRCVRLAYGMAHGLPPDRHGQGRPSPVSRPSAPSPCATHAVRERHTQEFGTYGRNKVAQSPHDVVVLVGGLRLTGWIPVCSPVCLSWMVKGCCWAVAAVSDMSEWRRDRPERSSVAGNTDRNGTSTLDPGC